MGKLVNTILEVSTISTFCFEQIFSQNLVNDQILEQFSTLLFRFNLGLEQSNPLYMFPVV